MLDLVGRVHLDIRRTGAGAAADYIFNGQKLAQPEIAWEMLRERNVLEIVCH